MAELSLVKNFVATTDMWSSETGQPFLSYTVHFIDNMETANVLLAGIVLTCGPHSK